MRSKMALVLLTLMTSLCFAASQKAPTKSKYLEPTGAVFMFSEKGGTYYEMHYKIRKALPGRVYFVVIFENPEAPNDPLITEFELPPDAKAIVFESRGIHSIRNNERYKVNLSMYRDAAHTKQLDQHDQEVLFSMPRQLLGDLRQRYGLTVQ